MYRKLILSISAFLLTLTICSAQMILNAETLRVAMLKDKENWSGNIGLAFSFTKNTNDIYNLSSNLALGYNGGENLWMIISNLNFNKVEDFDLQNSGVQHLRYNRQFGERLALEAFVQGQYDQVFAIDFRGLAGAGTRFELTRDQQDTAEEQDNTKKRSRIFLGTLFMYEYEKASEIEANIIRRDVRSSNYLSFSIFPNEQITIISTTYYQPRIDKFKDFRISSEVNLNIGFSSKKEDDEKGFWDKLTMNLIFSYNYDAFPVITIPKTQYNISNGLTYTL